MSGKKCFLIGHRETTESISKQLTEVIQKHIEECGVTEFIVGHHGGFDRLAALILTNIKTKYSGISLALLTAYHPATMNVNLPDGFDSIYYPSGMENTPPKYAIVKANQYVVDHSDYLIAYVWHSASNAMKLVEYAKRGQKKIVVTVIEKDK